jgi:hypothetical protein
LPYKLAVADLVATGKPVAQRLCEAPAFARL